MKCYNCYINLYDDNFVKLNILENNFNKLYPDSKFKYCYNCWVNKKEDIKCDICKSNYKGYYCNSNNPVIIELNGKINTEYIKVCNNCKCNGDDCDYCKKKIIDKIKKKWNIIIYKSITLSNNIIKYYIFKNLFNEKKLITYNPYNYKNNYYYYNYFNLHYYNDRLSYYYNK